MSMLNLESELFPAAIGKTPWQILRRMALHGPTDIKTIAEDNGLAISTVRSYVVQFCKLGLLQRSGMAEVAGGRPGQLYKFSSNTGCVIGVDIDRQALRTATVDLNGEVISSYKEPLTLPDEPAGAVQMIASGIHQALAETKMAQRFIIGVGVAVRGLFYGEDDVWLSWPSMQSLSRLPLKSMLSQELKLPVLVEDHGRARLLAELRHGAIKGIHNAIFVWIGTGISAHLCFNGKIYRGAHGITGEFGHLILDRDGPVCKCGRRGCLEAVASIPSIVEEVRQQIGRGSLSDLAARFATHLEDLTIEDILQAAEWGDQMAYIALHQAGERVGRALSIMLNIIGPSPVVLGGLGARSPVVLDAVRRTVRLEVIQPLFPKIEIQASQLDEGAGALGAALIEIESIFVQPSVPAALLSLWNKAYK